METATELSEEVADIGDELQRRLRCALDKLMETQGNLTKAYPQLVDIPHPAPELAGLHRIIRQARAAIERGDDDATWRALDQEAFEVMLHWDRARGRETPSDEELAQRRADANAYWAKMVPIWRAELAHH